MIGNRAALDQVPERATLGDSPGGGFRVRGGERRRVRVAIRARAALGQVPERATRGDAPGGGFLIRDGERWRFAMAIPLRGDFDAAALRAAARRTKDAAPARRPPARGAPRG